MTIPVVVVGAGGFGRETLDVLEAVNAALQAPLYEVVGVVDSGPRAVDLERLRVREVQYLGTEADWLALERADRYVIAIGDPKVRERVAMRWAGSAATPLSVIHPAAQVGTRTVVGPGTVICGGAQVSTNVVLGSHTHINPNATVGHDSVLGDFVSINPGATVSGDVSIEDLVLVGAGATVLQGLRLGRCSTVGAAACVTNNVLPETVVKGVPAR